VLGFLGSRLGKERHEQAPAFEALQKIERNTRETVAVHPEPDWQVLSLNNRLLNAPATFQVPLYSIQAGGGVGPSGAAIPGATVHNGDVVIHINEVQDPAGDGEGGDGQPGRRSADARERSCRHAAPGT
jgi:hypothetical protein